MAEFLITAPDGKKYKVTGANKEGALAALKERLNKPAAAPSGHDAMNAQATAAIDQTIAAGSEPRKAAFLQGALFNYGDEMYGGVKALQSGLKPGEYTRARDQARSLTDAAVAEHPGYAIGGGLATAVPAAVLTGGASLPAAVGGGALQGGISGYGAAKENDLQGALDTGAGAALGAAGGAAGYTLGKILEKFTSRGLASGTIFNALLGKPADLLAKMKQLGASAAETDEVLREVLRVNSAKNSTAAMAAVPAARDRLAQVNAQNIDDVSRLVSPDNATALIDQLQKQGQQIGSAGYEGGAYLNPATVGLVPDIANNPAMADALKAAEKLAAAQGRPFDVANLGIRDLDAIQRALTTSSKRMFESTPENTLLGPVYDDLAKNVNDMATSMAPELGQTQAQYAGIKGAQEAVELGKQALNPTKEFTEVAEEFSKLAPEAQEAYKAGLATRLRALLQTKAPTSNTGQVFNKGGIIEKLKAVGFPEEEIDAIIARSGAARETIDALVGGSQTARLQAAAKASESPMTKLKPMDVAASALLHWGTLGLWPAMRAAGASQERKAAEMVIKGLTDQSPEFLKNLFRYAPQRVTGPAGMFGGAAASQIGQPR